LRCIRIYQSAELAVANYLENDIYLDICTRIEQCCQGESNMMKSAVVHSVCWFQSSFAVCIKCFCLLYTLTYIYMDCKIENRLLAASSCLGISCLHLLMHLLVFTCICICICLLAYLFVYANLCIGLKTHLLDYAFVHYYPACSFVCLCLLTYTYWYWFASACSLCCLLVGLLVNLLTSEHAS
jgi:hypothetical protein